MGLNPRSATHRGHLAGNEVAVLCQHVRHHEWGQLRVGIRVDESIVWQRVAEVACRVVLHQVKKRRLRVVGWSDGGDLVVFIPSSISTGGSATSASSPSTTGLACVALSGGRKRQSARKIRFDEAPCKWFVYDDSIWVADVDKVEIDISGTQSSRNMLKVL